MAYFSDLSGTGQVRKVGYLSRGHPFTTGTPTEEFFDRPIALVERPFGEWRGFHTCDIGLCGWASLGAQAKFRYRDRTLSLGSTDIFVPGDDVVYEAPSLILHYIRRHSFVLSWGCGTVPDRC